MYTTTTVVLASAVSFAGGVYVAQNYKIPNLKVKCNRVTEWGSEKIDAIRSWEKEHRK